MTERGVMIEIPGLQERQEQYDREEPPDEADDSQDDLSNDCPGCYFPLNYCRCGGGDH